MKLVFEYLETVGAAGVPRRVTLGDDAAELPISGFLTPAKIVAQVVQYPRGAVEEFFDRGNRSWGISFGVHRGFGSESEAAVFQVKHIRQVTRKGTLRMTQGGTVLSCTALIQGVTPTWRGQSLMLRYEGLTGDWT